jgi:hypothetical protein
MIYEYSGPSRVQIMSKNQLLQMREEPEPYKKQLSKEMELLRLSIQANLGLLDPNRMSDVCHKEQAE